MMSAKYRTDTFMNAEDEHPERNLMNIQTAFYNALLSPPKLASSRNPEEFLGQSIFSDIPGTSLPLRLISAGTITATFPWTFDLKGMDCFLLLYTESGNGKLQAGGRNYVLAPSSLLFLNCNQHFRIDILTDPWEYRIYFLTGDMLSYYDRLLPDKLSLTTLSSYSDMIMALDKLPLQTYPADLAQQLFISDQLNHIITGCLISSMQKEEPKQIPQYIRDMKELFDNKYQEPYSLDELEDQLGISKYRLCREFGAAYDMSPLQYLNRRRIEVAAYLLLNSNNRVHEIGSRVGIENTNHFIHLFKKFMNCTPSEYKQRMTR